jgi:uncharacterized protein YqgC (DUF456 family)
MDWLWISIGIIAIVVGFLGCIVPIVPGPPISYVGLLLMQLTSNYFFESNFLMIWAGVTIGVTVLDYVVPAWGTKKYGGSKWGIWGSIIGLFIGMGFGPFGIIIGAFGGAVLGEMIAGKDTNDALRAGWGSFIGFLAGTLLKFIVSGMMGYYFIANLF